MDKTVPFERDAGAGSESTEPGFAARVQTFVRNPLRGLFGEAVEVAKNLPVALKRDSGSERGVARKENVEDFLRQVRSAAPRLGKGKLIFAMDATASREPTWKRACDIQAEMFKNTASIGGVEIQLAYYRGLCDFTASPWIRDPQEMLALMKAVRCQTGETQIRRVLKHALKENGNGRVSAVVFVGDCVEENAETLIKLATEAGVVGMPIFLFLEGEDTNAKEVFEEMARLSGGAFCVFDAKSPWQLKELLSAVAVYAAGGRQALVDYSKGRDVSVNLLTNQINQAFKGL